MQQLPLDQLPLITNGAEVEIVHVPQAQATGKTTDASNDTIVTDGFWSDLEKKILGAEKGETITADAGSRTTMPTSILKLLNHQEVNLILQWDGGEDIHIRWDHNVEIQGSAIALETLQQLTR